jgi:hypothetical protein
MTAGVAGDGDIDQWPDRLSMLPGRTGVCLGGGR